MNLGDLTLEARAGLPEALRVLVADYPREAWDRDPGFSDLIRFWLERHVMFRRVLEVMRDEAEEAADNKIDLPKYAAHLARYAGFFTHELHMHHTIEDQHYFPKLMTMDERIGWGFDLLDKDHHALDGHLAGFTEDTNALLAAISERTDHRASLDRLIARLGRTETMLDRHLTDEEDLVVPVLLKHAPMGLV